MTDARAQVPYGVIVWCAEECERQRSGERSVADMVAAWLYCRRHRGRTPRYRDVLALGRLVEPRTNIGGVRTVDVRVGYDAKLDWRQVPDALDRLLATCDGVWERRDTAELDRWYRQFEDVHPFRDGNGRVGSLLHAWGLGCILDPPHPPDWDDPAGYWGERTARADARLLETAALRWRSAGDDCD